MNGMKVSARSHEEIARIAATVRGKLAPATSEESGLDMLQIFERLNRFNVALRDGRRLGLDYDVKEMPIEVEGLATHLPRRAQIVVVLSERMYEKLESGDPRANFLAAHEIGHAVLHAGAICAGASLHGLHRRRAPLKAYEDSEWQANAFAANLLMPASGVRMLASRATQPEHVIARRFGVSVQAAGYRLRQLAIR